MSIEAMKLWLKALETSWYHVGTFCPTDAAIELYDEARDSLRQAIEQAQKQEQKVDWEKLYRLEVKKKEALVAKYERDIKPLTRIIPMAQKQEPDKYVMDIECTNCGTKQSGILTVNTTTPQRQPLTDEQIEAISAEIERSDFFDCVIPFARAIEAAHGIKE